MKKTALILAAVALGAAFGGSASAHGRVVVGVGFGFPLWGPAPWYYGPPPYYYYPPPGAVSNPPVTYIERQDAQQHAAPAASTDFWYYCEQSKTYYPYVKTCPGGWQRVTPTPPPG
jgi:hypothetical protein